MDAYKILDNKSLTSQSQMIADAAGLKVSDIVSVYSDFNPNECISYADEEAKYRFARQWAAHAIIHLEMLVHEVVSFPVVEEEQSSLVLAPMVVNGIGMIIAGVKGKRYSRDGLSNEDLMKQVLYAGEQYTRLA